MGGFLNFIKEYSMKILKRLFCKHDYVINRWHYTHGQCGNEPAYIEGYKVCKHCGKEKYFWAERGSKLESWIETTLQDKHT